MLTNSNRAPLLTLLPAHEEVPRQKLALSVLIPVYNERHIVAASIKRVLALESDLISRLEVIVVDDQSNDGTWPVLQELARQDARITLLRHERNSGKGAGLRTAIAHATGDVCIVHDADMEYNPADIPSLLVPFVEEGADAVFGSRYLSAAYRRALMHRHTLINRTITTLSNWFTDLNLTDVETCYKAINARLLKSIPIRSNDFRFEIEIAAKLAKRRARIFEVPIRYLPRTHEEGKKIKMRDGLLALQAMVRFAVIDDLYKEDEYGSAMLANMQHARRFNKWVGDTLRPHVGDRVLEVGAGFGNMTSQFIPRDLYVACDTNPHYLDYLRTYSIGKPYMRIVEADVERAESFQPLAGQFDTVIMANVLERLADPGAALANVREALEPGGKAIFVVPQNPALHGTLDEALQNRERYTREALQAALEKAGFMVREMRDFNRASVPGWYVNGKMLKRRVMSRAQLKLLEVTLPAVRRADGVCPWGGLSLIAVAEKV